MTIPAPAANMTAVCPTHGTVYWAAEGCPRCKAACAELTEFRSRLAELQHQVDILTADQDALDYGITQAGASVAEARTLAGRALRVARDTQDDVNGLIGRHGRVPAGPVREGRPYHRAARRSRRCAVPGGAA